ncbi:MAG: RagB/SusD family nutrient uptake outer membrane protein [Flavobacteriaceae bacterium]|nr:RagB/SusD family nutrient uptake outer membrane protein [Flavobacteriaceae bacterium]
MKKYIKEFITLFLVILVSSSCANFLEEDPRDILSPTIFFNSDLEAKAAVNGLYVPLYDGSMYGSYGLTKYYEYGADVIEPSREGGGVLRDCNDYLLDEDRDAGARDTWIQLYKIIQDANIIIDRVTDNPNITEQGNDQFLGETLFLRAFAYYHLTNIFGDVPYYRDNLSIDEVQVLPRYNKTLIRQDLITDLQNAQNLLPSSYTQSEQGRPTSWAAATLMVKIHLILKDWQNARDKAVEVINSSPHQLLDNYEDIFDPNNEYNAENIFEIVFVKDLNPNIITSIYSPRIRDEPRRSADRAALTAALDDRNEGFTGYGLAVAKCGFVDVFPTDDLRRAMNIAEEYLGYELKFQYMPKMWNLDQINSPRENHGDNYIVFRLADVYLMAAEAENELNGPNNAYQYINKVRERAYEPDQPYTGMSQEEFRQAIYDERKWELGGEGHRRMDLVRWGILLDVIQNTRHCSYDPAANIQPHHVLFPIPAEEILLNPALLETDPTNNGYR